MVIDGAVSIIITCLLSGPLFSFALNDSRDLLLTLEEKNALAKFKPTVTGYVKESFMKTDFYLIRWLRKAQLNIPTARNMLFQTIQWRAKNNISTIMSEDWSDLDEDYHMSFEGQDKMGRPMLTIDIGDWDLRAAVIHGNIRRLRRYLTYSTEKIFQRVLEVQKNTGRPVTRGMVLVDGDGVNLRQHGCPLCIAFLVQWVLEKETYYPSISDETIIINIPAIGTVILNACRAVMSPDLSAQTKSFDANKRAWMRYLDDRIDRSERSQRYGGTKK